jgi:ribulose-5-phosphate 4-epimerase/fuculose-1-phosphate aldolase
LLPISQHALKFYGHISYHDYEGFALDLGERERLVADLGQKNKSMILRNHGLLVCGRSIPEAFVEVYSLERACQGQIASLSGGSRLIIPPAEVCERTASQYNSDAAARQAHAKKAWSSALRLIDGGFAQ